MIHSMKVNIFNKRVFENTIILILLLGLYIFGNNIRYIENTINVTSSYSYVGTDEFIVTDKKLDMLDNFKLCSLEVAKEDMRVVIPCTLLDLKHNIGDKVTVDIYIDKNVLYYILK